MIRTWVSPARVKGSRQNPPGLSETSPRRHKARPGSGQEPGPEPPASGSHHPLSRIHFHTLLLVTPL